MLKQLTADEKQEPALEHAFKVRIALSQGNYGRFFKLYRDAPNCGAALIDVFIDKIRVLSLRNLAVGFVATNLDLAHISNMHAFDSHEDCEKFLRGIGCQITTLAEDHKKLDCRASIQALRKAPLKVRRAQGK
jgi:hypothetical protein